MKPESDCGNTREGGCARLESGTAFMPGVSEKRLEKAARREKDKCAKFRLLACLGRKKGHSIRRISRDLKTAYSTIRDWLLRMRDRGLKGRFNARPKGRRARLPLRIIRTVRRRLKRSPKKCDFETGSWQMDMVTEMIRKEFGVTVRARTLRRWLRRIGFSWRKDRYVPYRSVSKERQEEFKREVGERAAQRRADGMTVFAEDEAAVQRSQNPAYGWRPIGGREQVRASFSRESVRIFGAMSQDELRIKIVESTNSETFREFLGEIRRDRPRLFMALDNASYHKSKAVREYVESAGGDVGLEFLPPYTPQLNPVETVWRNLKKRLAGRLSNLINDSNNLSDSFWTKPGFYEGFSRHERQLLGSVVRIFNPITRLFRSLDELKAAITAILGREMGNRLKGYLVA